MSRGKGWIGFGATMITWFVIVVENHLAHDTHELVAPSNGDAGKGVVVPVGAVGAVGAVGELDGPSNIGNIDDAGAGDPDR